MKQLFCIAFLICASTAHAEDCVTSCTANKYVNYDAQVICQQVCEVKEALKTVAKELHKQTEILQGVKK